MITRKNDAPTTEGWYWYRDADGETTSFVFYSSLWECLCQTTPFSFGNGPLKYLQGEWQGPIIPNNKVSVNDQTSSS